MITKKFRLTKSDTLAIRMTELAITAYLTTSLRIVVRPIFQEIDSWTEKLPSDHKEATDQKVYLKVSFLNDGQMVYLGCCCYIQNELGDEDCWKASHVRIEDAKGTPLRRFHFDSAGLIS